MSKWIEFIDRGPSTTGKTATWSVVAKDSGGELGQVRWFARWRRYGFYPTPETVFEQDCLRDIANFCESKTQEHRSRAVVA